MSAIFPYDTNKSTEQDIYESTQAALNGRTVSKKIKPFVAGNDEQEWIIKGYEKYVFVFHTSDYGKIINTLVISKAEKHPDQQDVSKETFNDKEFITKMYKLFAGKEREMLEQKRQEMRAHFISEFKTYMKK